MSYFIAHTISFSKDLETFKLKGGDNNLIPRSNSWTGEMPIDILYYHLNGGMVQLKGTSEKNAFIRFLMGKYRFDGSYYNSKNQEPTPQEVINFDRKFVKALKQGLQSLSNEKNSVVYLSNENCYVHKANPTRAKTCRDEKFAQSFTHFRALEVAKSYEKYGAILKIYKSTKFK